MTDMTVADVARVCGVTERTVRRWLREGRLPAIRVGGRVRVSDRAVRELAASYGHPPPAGPSDVSDADRWWQSLADPARLASLDARRADRAIALMDLVREMSVGSGGPDDAAALVREGRDEQDARWDERLG
jgi:excisionase family DNA binding protein